MLEVIKRDGTKVPFDRKKIAVAIEKAMNSSSGIYEDGQADRIAKEIEDYAKEMHKERRFMPLKIRYIIVLFKQITRLRREPTKTIKPFRHLNGRPIRRIRTYSVCWIIRILMF